MAVSYETMHESTLKDYFLGMIDESRLNHDLEGSVVHTSLDMITHYVNPMDSDFQVEPTHLVKLCDAVLSGKLNAAHLELIGYCLVASDHFFWDEESKSGELVAETAYDWSSPEINYPLTIGNIEKFRERLLTGSDTFTKADAVQ
ncbi:MAG: hypothetical protein M3362_21685 [Acidobacteriota bacterium]|nr:hypothetical protein [Acidobacteriota bacterium]